MTEQEITSELRNASFVAAEMVDEKTLHLIFNTSNDESGVSPELKTLQIVIESANKIEIIG